MTSEQDLIERLLEVGIDVPLEGEWPTGAKYKIKSFEDGVITLDILPVESTEWIEITNTIRTQI